MEQVFTYIYENNIWGNNLNNKYSGSSGDGSTIEFNKDTYINFVQNFIKDHNITSVVDLGCGDFRCGGLIYDELDVKYTGYDVYKKVVDFNTSNRSGTKYNFIHLDLVYSKVAIKVFLAFLTILLLIEFYSEPFLVKDVKIKVPE